MKLLIFTLDLARNNYPIITTVNGLPYDCTSLLPCSTLLGGVVVLTSNSIIYVDQSARRVPLPLNGWQQRISDLPIPVLSTEDQQCNLELEGCRAAFIDGKTFVIVLRDGTVYPVEVTVDGKTVSKLSIGPALARATIPSVLKRVTDNLLFLGSTVASSLLLRTFHVEEEIMDDLAPNVPVIPAVNAGAPMDLDDDDGTFSSLTLPNTSPSIPLSDIYGPSALPAQPSNNSLYNSNGTTKKMRSVLHLSLCDNIPAYGPIHDMAFSLARNGVRRMQFFLRN